MKPLISQLVGLSALFAFIDANELPPQSIPIPCATICGPIVELTALCSKKRSIAISKSPMRRNIEHERLFDAPSSQNRGAHRHDKRLFVTLIPPPASPPRQQEQSTPQPSPLPSHPPPSQQQPQPQAPPQKQPPPAPAPPPASKTPEQKPPPPQQEKTSAAPPAETSRASGGKEKGPDAMSTSSAGSSRGQGSVTATMSPIPSMAGNSMAGMLDGDGGSSPDMDSSKGPESAEEICVCENRSFDVSTLTALCASCVASKSKLHDAANLELIMSTCDFPEQPYSPDKDKLVNNIVVKALMPAQSGNSTTSRGNGSRLREPSSVVCLIGVVLLASVVSL